MNNISNEDRTINVEGGKGVKREYVTDKQLEVIKNKLKTKLEGNKYHGLEKFTSLTGMNVECHTLGNVRESDNQYTLKKDLSNYFTDIFFKRFLTRDENFFLYSVLNTAFKERSGLNPPQNLIVKGSAALSLYTFNMYDKVVESYHKLNEEQQGICREVVETIKPTSSDLDLAMPFPDTMTDTESIMAMGLRTYKQFAFYMKHNDLIKNLITDFCNSKHVKEGFNNTTILDSLRELFNIDANIDINADSFCLAISVGSSLYTRLMNDFETECYQLDLPNMMMSFKAVEGIVQPTTMINPFIVTLIQVIMNIKVVYKPTCRYIKLKLPIIDLAAVPESSIGKDITRYKCPINLTRSELQAAKKHMMTRGVYDCNIYAITPDHAINADIRSMLYERNYFIWEDDKVPKRLMRDIFYNILLLQQSEGPNAAKTEAEVFYNCINNIYETCMDTDKNVSAWLTCMESSRCKTKLFQHIIEKINSMAHTLNHNKNDELLPYYIRQFELYDQYIEEFKDFMETLRFTANFVHTAFTQCIQVFP